MSDFSRLVNEETVLLNGPMFSSEAVQEYVTHPEKRHNKIGNFATDAAKECFVIYSLCDKKHDLD